MALAFTLSMPNVASWNGRWSGEGKRYVRIVPCRSRAKIDELLAKGYWHHSWPDGWGAGVEVKEVDATTARKLKKQSNGFCGYDWMVDSIMQTGKIRPAYTGCYTS